MTVELGTPQKSPIRRGGKMAKTKLPDGMRLPMPPPTKSFKDRKNDYKRNAKHKKKSHENYSSWDSRLLSAPH